MSEAEIIQFANALFDEVDSDKSGTVDITEVRAAMQKVAQAFNATVSEEDVANSMKTMDTNGDGIVTREEFLNLVKSSFGK